MNHLVQSTGPLVLVADDDDMIRGITMRMLQEIGITAYEAHDGREALALIRANGQRIAVLITDLHMPNMDGRELLKLIKSEGILIPRLILFSSGIGISEETDRELQALGAQLLSKPCEKSELIAALGDLSALHALTPSS